MESRKEARRYWFPKPYADVVAKLRVPGGFVLLASFLLLSRPSRESLLYGAPISLAGLLLRGWAAGHLAKNQNLATGGPYGHVRNPLYLGTLTAAAGLVICSREWLLAAVFAGVFLFIYLPVIELEEQHLRKIFPEYASYADRVPVILPLLRGAGSDAPFRWSLYRQNQEYQAGLGFVGALLYLVWRAY